MKNLVRSISVGLLVFVVHNLACGQSLTATDFLDVQASQDQAYIGLYKSGTSGVDWGNFITSEANNFTMGAYANSSSGTGQFNFLEYKYAPDQWGSYYYYLNLKTPTTHTSYLQLDADFVNLGRNKAISAFNNEFSITNAHGQYGSGLTWFTYYEPSNPSSRNGGVRAYLTADGQEFYFENYFNDYEIPFFKAVTWKHLEINAENREIYLNPTRKLVGSNHTGDWGTVTINSYKKVQNTALTVSGATYIANPNDTSARTNAAFDPNGANKYLLKVESGVLSEDFALATVANWPDYVFKPGYNLLSLQQVEEHIEECGHLPGIPSETEVKDNGYSMGDMDAKLLEKIEELTLYLLDQQEQIQSLQEQVQHLKATRQ